MKITVSRLKALTRHIYILECGKLPFRGTLRTWTSAINIYITVNQSSGMHCPLSMADDWNTLSQLTSGIREALSEFHSPQVVSSVTVSFEAECRAV